MQGESLEYMGFEVVGNVRYNTGNKKGLGPEKRVRSLRITAETVEHTAALAKLKLTREELAQAAGQLEEILACMDVLDKVDCGTHVQKDERRNILREDVCGPSLDRDLLLAGAPASDGAYFLVPKTVG